MDIVTARSKVRRRQRAARTDDSDAYALGGGLNLVDPPATIKPGYALAAENYEIGVDGGYERLGGYERFDGHPRPSDQSYWILAFRHAAPFPTLLAAGADVADADANGAGAVIEAVELAPWGRCYCAYADDLTQAVWTHTGVVSDLQPAVAAPSVGSYGVDLNGVGLDADHASSRDVAPQNVWLLSEDASSGLHELRNGWIANVSDPVANSGDQLRLSVFVKRANARYIRLYPDLLAAAFVGAAVPVAVFDLEAEDWLSLSATVAASSVEALADGWYRLSIVTAALASNQNAFDAVVGLLDDTATASHAGSTARTCYVTGLNTDKRTGAAPQLAPFVRSRRVAELPLSAGIGYVALRAVTGSFADNTEGNQGPLLVEGSVTVGTWSGKEQERGGPTVDKHLEYLEAAAEAVRSAINTLPGEGAVRGVWFYQGKVFGFRDDGAACKMFKSTTSGWSEVTFAEHLAFDAALAAGADLVLEGATVNGQTSGATATVKRVNIVGGWSGGTGTLALSGITGTFQDNEPLRVGSTAVATVNGVKFTPSWTAGGRYRFRTYNFFGAANKRRMYGVNGLNYGFEYDEADGVLAIIKTGMPTDAPTHVGVLVNGKQLAYAFRGGSTQLSGVGGPSTWTVTLGAAEIMVGDDITAFLEAAADSLFIFTRSSSKQLIGNAADGYQLQDFDSENGAIADSVQKIGFGIHLDDRGFASLLTSDRHGNYVANTFSRLIQPLVNALLKTTSVTESVIYRGGNRYRCFFADGRFVSIGVAGNKVTGHMACNYGKVVRCACSEEDTDGSERIFFGSDDGYIYEAEVGTSFDGGNVSASLRPAYHHSGHPDRTKTYRAGRVEAVLQGPATLMVTPDLSFGKTILTERDCSAELGGGIWEYLARWEAFNYDDTLEPLKTFRIGADGTNIGLLLRHVSKREPPHTLRAVIFQSSLRNLKRGAAVG